MKIGGNDNDSQLTMLEICTRYGSFCARKKGAGAARGLIGQRESENGKFLHCYHCILWWGEIFRGRSSYCVVETFEVMVVRTEHGNGMLCCITKEKLVSDFFFIFCSTTKKKDFSTKKCRNTVCSVQWLGYDVLIVIIRSFKDRA